MDGQSSQGHGAQIAGATQRSLEVMIQPAGARWTLLSLGPSSSYTGGVTGLTKDVGMCPLGARSKELSGAG